MGFIMNGLNAERYDRNYPTQTLVKRIVGYFQPHAHSMIIVAISLTCMTLVQAGLPILIAHTIDVFHDNPVPQALIALVGFVLVIALLDWSLNYIRQIFTTRTVADVVLGLRRDVSTAVMRHDLSFYDQLAYGRAVSRVTTDTQGFTNVITLTMDLFNQTLVVLAISTWLLMTNLQLALIALAGAPVIMLVALSFRRIARQTAQRAQRATATINAAIQQTVSGITIAKSFRQEATIYEQFEEANRLAYQVQLRRGLVYDTIFPVLDLLTGVGTAIVIYFGGRLVLEGSVSPGHWYLFVQTLALFYFPLTGIASFWSQFQQGLAASERIFALIDAEPKVSQHGAAVLPRVQGRIAFQNVQFSYRPGEIVLPGLSLTIPAAQKVAIVGHSGAGKTSLLRLLARFYEFHGGALLVDDYDIRTLDLPHYRKQIGVVSQSPVLFSGTVMDNIRYGRPEATDQEVERIAMQIAHGAWVADLPHGLMTTVGERGVQLSLGQRQLVSLARVLLHNPAIFLLDEATASVDPFTEQQIQASLDLVMHGRTSIVIAHRLSTVRSVDRILVMEAGQIVEDGNHETLLARGGSYAHLYNTYFRHQSISYINQIGGEEAIG